MASVAGPADCGQDSEDDDGYILVDAGAGANLDGANPAAQLSIESAAITEYREEVSSCVPRANAFPVPTHACRSTPKVTLQEH